MGGWAIREPTSNTALGPDIASSREPVELQQALPAATSPETPVSAIIATDREVEALVSVYLLVLGSILRRQPHFQQIWDGTVEVDDLSHIRSDVDSIREDSAGSGSLKGAQALSIHTVECRAGWWKPSQGSPQCASQEKAPAQPELRWLASKL